ncbi:MAG: 4Fe-4S binding protein [Candidatus Altiarchaeota archaeon]|nr:4Fe-4S binding protein [Candidatus Altiarchaeota archaeon]
MFIKVLKNIFKKRETLQGFTREFPKNRIGRISYNQKKCTKAYECVKYCPANAISVRADKFIQIDHEKCIRCKICVRVCPSKALKAIKES